MKMLFVSRGEKIALRRVNGMVAMQINDARKFADEHR